MARTPTRRQADITTKPQLSITAVRDFAFPPPDNINNNEDRESRDADRELDEAGDAPEHRFWTPEPEPYDTEKYKAWGRKHYGDDWYEQRETMLQERNAVAEAAAEEKYKERLLKEPPTNSIFGSWPMTKEEPDEKYRAWDALGVSCEEQAEIVRIFGLKPEPEPEPEPGKADAPASECVSQPRASSPRPPKGTSSRTRGGRITKNTAQSQSVANRGTRSRQATPTSAKAPMPDRPSKQVRRAPDKPDDGIAQGSRKTSTRQPKVYKKERESRRLAGRLPEYGMLPKRGEAASPHEHPSNTYKPNPQSPRSYALSKKKSTAVKGAKP